MPLGFFIIGSTVTLDLFLRWATQGPLGPLVLVRFRKMTLINVILNICDDQDTQNVLK